MKAKTTPLWFLIAAALAAAIWMINTYVQPADSGPKPLFPGLRGDQLVSIDVVPAGNRQISVVRTNQTWFLEKPMVYPAQAAALDGLISALQKLSPTLTFSAGDLSGRKNADAEFGFDNPQFTLDFASASQNWHLLVGNLTAPGDGVYLRIVGTSGAFLTDPAWLQFLPHDAGEWRDTTLADVPPTLDWLMVTNGSQAIELRRDATNRLWRMVRPLQARANNFRIVTAIQQLNAAKVSKFVNDDPRADLSVYGLEPAALAVGLGYGTNLETAILVGKDANSLGNEVYARREGWNTVVSTPKEPLASWRGTVNDFRDPNLVELTAPVAEIEVQGENAFLLRQCGSNNWVAVGEKFPIEADQVTGFEKMFASLRIADFAQDVVTAAGLQSFGLAHPVSMVTLRSAAGDTNSVIAQVLFGLATNNEVYAKCSGENFVYGIALDQMKALPLKADYFRERHVWDFSETNVASVTLRQNGQTRQMIHGGVNDWALAPGSQGIISSTAAVEEAMHRLGQLTVAGWIGRGISPEQIGQTTNSLSITIELKSGAKYGVDFGADVKPGVAFAATTLEGDRWTFVFPPILYPFVADYLTIPAATP